MITAPTITLQGLSHFSRGCLSTWYSVINIAFSEGCVSEYLTTFLHGSTVISAHYFIAGSITHLLRVCVNLVQCYRYSILRRVCVSISKHFLTWVNCDHCSHYFIAASIYHTSDEGVRSVIDIVFSERYISAYLN